jgi:hypothetical protein
VKRVIFVMCTIAACGAAEARAQDTTLAVRPGMTEEQVRSRWGEPLAIRRIGEWTYLFYDNGVEAYVGYHDVVFLQGGQVVDAIVRAPGRLYLGQSSSPPDRAPEFTPPAQSPADRKPDAPGAVTGVRVNQ